MTHSSVAREREIVALLEMERYGVCLKAAAEAMGKGLENASLWVTEAATRQRTEAAIAARLEHVDAALAWFMQQCKIERACQD